jgi:hypothetical protein
MHSSGFVQLMLDLGHMKASPMKLICSTIGIQKHESAAAVFFFGKKMHYPNNSVSLFEDFN